MTANTLFENALALITTQKTDVSDYADFALPVINLLICECFGLNNALRISAKKLPQVELPLVNSAEDEVDFEPQLLLAVLPYGVCAKLLVEDDAQKALYFQNLYAAAVNDSAVAVPQPIVDVYGGDGE